MDAACPRRWKCASQHITQQAPAKASSCHTDRAPAAELSEAADQTPYTPDTAAQLCVLVLCVLIFTAVVAVASIAMTQQY